MECLSRATLLVALLALDPSVAAADPPRVHFDLPYAIACRDVTPPACAAASPHERLIEARFELSSLLLAGDEDDLTQYFIRIDSPRRSLVVVDYLPKTLHESPMASPIGVHHTRESGGKIGISLSGQYELLTSVTPTAELSQKQGSSVKYDLLPPLETVAASGTLLRGAGVFFKLKSSPRHLLEGARQYALVLRVPREWRADYVRVHCEAHGVRRGFVSSFDESIRCGERDFLVALYQEGDESARVSAEQFAVQEAKLRTAAGSVKGSPKGKKTSSTWLPTISQLAHTP
jgi:hypothetical protein